jgi:membrane protein YdbS with pleckstrin-like domain
MAADVPNSTQITTSEVNQTPPVLPVGAAGTIPPAGAVPQAQVANANASAGAAAAVAAQQGQDLATDSGLGAKQEEARHEVDDEVIVWEGRYSMRNFLGRLIGMGVLSIAWIGLAFYTWGGYAHDGNAIYFLTIVTGIALGIFWLGLVRRIVLARYGHYYRLTNRRLFVSTGLFNRRRDQMELLHIQDVYTKQTFTGRMLGLGTVVVCSKEQTLPIVYLAGVDNPKHVMDLVWRQSRMERQGSAVQVDQV